MHARHREAHRLDSAGWLRASVLGANDGIVSTASLILGVAASRATHDSILIAGIAGLVAGAMSMATGEYVSVQSQADTEAAALGKERAELSANAEGELHELAQIYIARGLAPDLANQVAASLMAHDALAAHSQDELGITDATSAKPLQAAAASALSFAVGALLPLLVVMLAPHAQLIAWTVAATLVSLAFLGGLAARVGGASVGKGIVRVTFWSALSMAAAVGIGMLVGTAV